jgi:uncharacterized sodium:solute symporter family permease YidK
MLRTAVAIDSLVNLIKAARNISKFYVVITFRLYSYVLGTNSDLCHLQHKMNGFYNLDEKCLQRGTD